MTSHTLNFGDLTANKPGGQKHCFIIPPSNSLIDADGLMLFFQMKLTVESDL